jgi:aryl-alcohol dehydrogenase-like predicted oxidoreductase
MHQNILTPSGVPLTAITYGTGGRWSPELDELNTALIRNAFEQGVRSFDTAQIYGAGAREGRSEELLGQTLRDVRPLCVLSSKVARKIEKPDDILRVFEDSLRRLQTDYIDIYFVHWPGAHTPVTETLQAFRKLKEQKLIRAIGVSNFSAAQLREAVAYTPIDVIQPNYNLLARDIEPDIVPICREHSIGIMCYSPTEKGLLSGRYRFDDPAAIPPSYRRRPWFQPSGLTKSAALLERIQQLAARHRTTATQIAIAWLLHQPHVSSVIIGTKDAAHLQENVQAAAVTLSVQDVRDLDEASRLALETA